MINRFALSLFMHRVRYERNVRGHATLYTTVMVYLFPMSTTIYLSNEPGKKWCVKSYMNEREREREIERERERERDRERDRQRGREIERERERDRERQRERERGERDRERVRERQRERQRE